MLVSAANEQVLTMLVCAANEQVLTMLVCAVTIYTIHLNSYNYKHKNSQVVQPQLNRIVNNCNNVIKRPMITVFVHENWKWTKLRVRVTHEKRGQPF